MDFLKRFVAFAVLSFSLVFSLFGEINVINPIEGIWANKQMLIIDTSDGSDYFYSLNGSDPMVAGFAYDGPVLIDLTGFVNIRISKGFVGGETTDIAFTVNQEYSSDEDERVFIDSYVDAGIVSYSAGDEIHVPETMRYSLEENPRSFLKGQVLKYSEACSFSRFIPCTVTNGKSFWRFTIKTNPKSTGTYSRRDLPIKVHNWESISFEDDNLIYRIDDGFWGLPKSDVKIDRSKNHIVYWQNLAYNRDNPIEFFVLPPKPKLEKSTNKDGSISFYFDGDESYSMGVIIKDVENQELFTELCADVFQGDYVKDRLEVAVYSDSFYQGTMDIDYEIDKRPPPVPVFSAETMGFHVHGSLNLNVKSVKNTELYVAVSEPMVLDEIQEIYSADSRVLKNVKTGDFMNTGNSLDFVFKPLDGHSTFYKVSAYSRLDTVRSDIVEYNVIVDDYDFYMDCNADSSLANGTREHPFTSFPQFFDAVRNYRSVNLFVFGNAVFPEGKTEIAFNCKIKGYEKAILQFPKGASIVVRNSTLQIEDCRLESDNRTLSRNVPTSIVKLEHSVFDASNVEFSSSGKKNNTVIDAENSVIMFRDSFFSVTATTYASLVSASDTYVDISSCRIGISADTSIVFSVRGSKFFMKDSSVSLSGAIGRVAELFGVTAKILNNNFKADLKKNKTNGDPVFSDKDSKVETTANYVLGF